jgi:hypothetical protein
MNLSIETAIQASYLYGRYFSVRGSAAGGGAPDPHDNLSIVNRLMRLHWLQCRDQHEEKLSQPKQHSKPPGVMTAFFAVMEIEEVVNNWHFLIMGKRCNPRKGVFILADRVSEEDALMLYQDLKGCVRMGLITLGLVRPSVTIRGVRCPECNRMTLTYNPDEIDGDIFCANNECHDVDGHKFRFNYSDWPLLIGEKNTALGA